MSNKKKRHRPQVKRQYISWQRGCLAFALASLVIVMSVIATTVHALR